MLLVVEGMYIAAHVREADQGCMMMTDEVSCVRISNQMTEQGA
jgi:hypothetical protein